MDRSKFTSLFFSSHERRLRAGWRLLGHSALLVVFIGVFSLPVGLVMVSLDGLSMEALLISGVLVLFLAITASVYLARRLLDRRSFRSLGLRWDGRAARDLLAGVLLSGLMMGLVFLSFWIAGWIDFQGFAWEFEGPGRALAGTALALFAFTLVGWHEELLSRGYWLQNLSEGLNLAWGVSLSSALFALMHLLNPFVSLAAILGLFAAGLFLAYAYLRTRQLWLPIGLHIGWNFFEGTVFGFPVSGSSFFSLVRHEVSGPPLITGGEFGPEAGLIMLPALLLGVLLVYLYTQGRSAPVQVTNP